MSRAKVWLFFSLFAVLLALQAVGDSPELRSNHTAARRGYLLVLPPRS